MLSEFLTCLLIFREDITIRGGRMAAKVFVIVGNTRADYEGTKKVCVPLFFSFIYFCWGEGSKECIFLGAPSILISWIRDKNYLQPNFRVLSV